MASGFALGSPFEDGHWSGDPDKTALYIDLRFDVLLHPFQEEILMRSILEERIPSVHWTPQASGTAIKPEEAAHLEFMWSRHLEEIGLSPIQFSEEISTAERYWEGAVSRIVVNAYERNPRARRACIDYHGCKCAVCGFDFEEVFGEIGKVYIQVHYLKQLAEIGEQYEINPVTDLIPVCPNCHAMLHWRTPPFPCEELKVIREKQPSSTS
jgi:5-methylcytosine-specific restriction protein A